MIDLWSQDEPGFNKSGELNYMITAMCLAYLQDKGESYQTHADIMSALECAKQEWYRRKVAPYENEKAQANGDVYAPNYLDELDLELLRG